MASSGYGKEQGPRYRKPVSIKPLRMMMSVPDDRFAMETRLVVLNFMGLVPASCPASAAVSDGRRLDVQIGDGIEEAIVSHSTMHLELWPPLEEEGNEIDDFPQDSDGMSGRNHDNKLVDEGTSLDFSSAKGVPQADSQSISSIPEVHLVEDHQASFMSADQLSHPALMTSYLLPSTAQLQLPISGSPYSVSPSLSPVVERQLSHRSSGSSTRSRLSGHHNSYVDVRLVDVESLVKARSVTPLALPLREELFREFDDRLAEEPGDADGNSALTPESEVAEMLRILGDRVQEEFGEELQRAAAELLPQGPASLSYSSVRDAALRMLGHSAPSWTQVVLVLLLGQRVAMSQLMRGEHCIGKLADYTTQFIGDHIADFIVRNGGWQSILEIDCEEMLLDDVDSRRSPPTDVVPHELMGVGVTDSNDNSLDMSMDISNNLFEYDTMDTVIMSDLYDMALPSAEEISTTEVEKSSDLEHSKFKGADSTVDGDAFSVNESTEKNASNDGNEGGTVYMTLCALAVAGACFFYQKLWKS